MRLTGSPGLDPLHHADADAALSRNFADALAGASAAWTARSVALSGPRSPQVLALSATPALTRSTMIERSNSAKTPSDAVSHGPPAVPPFRKF